LKRRTFAAIDAAVIVVAFSLFFLIPGAALDEGAPDRLVVTLGDGASPTVYPLQPDRVIKLEGRFGNTVAKIEDGTVRVSSSPCPNKICVRLGKASRSGQVLVCMPNRVSIRLATGGEGDLDAIVR
jgi:hypothetical protein